MSQSFYALPEDQFDTHGAEVSMKNVTGSAAEGIIRAWKKGFEGFWRTPRTHQERAFTRDQLQAVLDRDKVGFGQILMESKAFRDFIIAAYPQHVGSSDREVMSEEEDEAKLLPSRFLDTPYQLDNSLNITGDLKSVWS